MNPLYPCWILRLFLHGTSLFVSTCFFPWRLKSLLDFSVKFLLFVRNGVTDCSEGCSLGGRDHLSFMSSLV